MNNNEELIRQIQEIIQALTAEQSKLQQGTKAYDRMATGVLAFSNALKILNRSVATSDRQLSNFASKMESVLTGQITRFQALGARARTAEIQPIIQRGRAEAMLEPLRQDDFSNVNIRQIPEGNVPSATSKAADRLKADRTRLESEILKNDAARKKLVASMDALRAVETRAGTVGTPAQKSKDVIEAKTFDPTKATDAAAISAMSAEIKKSTTQYKIATADNVQAIRNYQKQFSDLEKNDRRIATAAEKNVAAREKLNARLVEVNKLKAQFGEAPVTLAPKEQPLVRQPDESSEEFVKRIRAQTKELDSAYKQQLAIVNQYREKIDEAASRSSKTARAKNQVIEQLRKEAEEAKRLLVEQSGRADPLADAGIIGQTPEDRDRFSSAVLGNKATIREQEDQIRDQNRIRQQQEAAVRSYQETLGREAAAEQKANELMRKSIANREALNKQRQAAFEHQRKIQDLEKALPGGAKAARTLDERAARIDPMFTRENIKSVNIEGSTDISKVKYQYTTAEGVIKSATFTVDKFGKVLVDTQRRFRGFFENVGRDVQEALKWSIAIGLVYGPLNALNQLMDTAIKNEAALADVSIALGNATQTVGEIFAATAQIAQETGEELSGVIEAYNLAYRATGGIADATDRFAVANKLLTDAITLSKLSTLDQAEAIDVLTSALRQTGAPLTEGTQLLDKWIAVTKVAGVDLTTLALGFSVVGDAAEAVGLKAEELSAVLAVLAEGSSQSGREIANTARALISGFQSDNARKELTKLGISFVKSTGEAKGFLELMQEIGKLRTDGIINDDQFNRLTLAIGGGSRRSAAALNFIENLGKINTLIDAQANAEGSAAAALEKKLDTVQTSITRLGNAFQELAQAFGENGGILDNFRTLVDLATTLTNALTGLAEVAGKAGPALAVALAASAYFGLNPGKAQLAASTIGSFGAELSNRANGNRQRVIQGVGAGTMGNNGFMLGGTQATSNFIQRGIPYAAGALAVGIPAFQNASQGNLEQAGGNVVGGIIGGLVGWAGGPGGVYLGSTLGSAIGEGVVNWAKSYKTVVADAFAPSPYKPPAGATTPGATPEERAATLLQGSQGSTGLAFIDNLLGKFTTSFLSTFGKGIGGTSTGLTGFNDTQAQLVMLELRHQLGIVPDEMYNKIIKAFQDAKIQIDLKNARPVQTTPETDQQLEFFQTLREEELKKQFGAGDIGAAAYNRGLRGLEGFSANAPQFADALKGMQGFDTQTFFKQYSLIVSKGQDADLERLNQLKQAIDETRAEMASGSLDATQYAQSQDLLEQQTLDLAQAVEELNNQYLAQSKLLPTLEFSKINLVGTSPQGIEDLAQQVSREEIQKQVDLGNLSQEAADAIIANFEDIIVTINGVATLFQDTTADAINKAVEQLKEQKKIIDEAASELGWQTMDVTQSQLMSLLQPGGAYDKFAKKLTDAGVALDLQDSAVVTSGGEVNKIYQKDFKLIQFLLQEILKVDQKQLDGMFNLPEGASFWVPAQAAKLAPEAAGTLTESLLQEIANNTAQTAQAVSNPPPSGIASAAVPPGVNATTTTQQTSTTEQIKNFGVYTPTPPPPSLQDLLKNYGVYTPQAQPANTEGMFQKIIDAIKAGFDAWMSTNPFGPTKAPSTDAFDFSRPQPSAPSTGLQDIGSLFAQGISNLTTRLNLSIENRTVVQVDGRQIASIVKQYLKSDLLKYSGGTSGKTVNVI